METLINSILDALQDAEVPIDALYSPNYLKHCAERMADWSVSQNWQDPPIALRSFYGLVAQLGLGCELYNQAITNIWRIIRDYHDDLSNEEFEMIASL